MNLKTDGLNCKMIFKSGERIERLHSCSKQCRRIYICLFCVAKYLLGAPKPLNCTVPEQAVRLYRFVKWECGFDKADDLEANEEICGQQQIAWLWLVEHLETGLWRMAPVRRQSLRSAGYHQRHWRRAKILWLPYKHEIPAGSLHDGNGTLAPGYCGWDTAAFVYEMYLTPKGMENAPPLRWWLQSSTTLKWWVKNSLSPVWICIPMAERWTDLSEDRL